MEAKKVLLIFGSLSLKNKKADPDLLCKLLNDAAGGEAVYSYSRFEDLAFFVSEDSSKIWDLKHGYDIADFDFIYFRRWGDMPEAAMACTMYLKCHKVGFIDHELDRPGAIDKLTQHWKLWEADLPIPSTLYVPTNYISKISNEHLSNFGLSNPLIVKSADGTRGNDNYLAKDLDEAKQILKSNPGMRFLIQNYIPNDGDYRVIVGGNKILMTIERKASGGSHKNNTSQGGSAKLVDESVFSLDVQGEIVHAAQAFKRELAGVDIVFDKQTGKHYFFEVNRSPQIENSSHSEEKADVLHQFFMDEIRLNVEHGDSEVIGRVEKLDLPKYKIKDVRARVDTGAKTSAIWASDISRLDDGTLSFHLFDKNSPHYTGERIVAKSFTETVVASSMGLKQKRYKVKLPILIKGRKILANFTLADRSQQVYPILIGRNVLRGKFLVDVTQGAPLREAENSRTKELRKLLKSDRKDKS